MSKLKNIQKYLHKTEELLNLDWEEFRKTLNFEDALDFLGKTATGQIPIYLSTKGFLIYGLFLPETYLEEDYINTLLEWNDLPPAGWGHVIQFKNGEEVHDTEPPMEYQQIEILKETDPTFFLLTFDGLDRQIQLNQKLHHLLEVRWVDREEAFCRIDKNGDYKPIITVLDEENIICTMAEEAFNYYASLTEMALVRFFDFSRFKQPTKNIGAENVERSKVQIEEDEIYAKKGIQLSAEGQELGGWLRGFQIIRTKKTAEESEQIYLRNNPDDYVTFQAFDWKHNTIDEISCDPDSWASYYDDNDLPFGTTPVFFRSEVLSKYKQDTEKYQIDHRKIRCRGVWSIEFDINDEGQVHVYLCDLTKLPYEEQLYWKSFNERPKGSISERAYKTDFLADWDDSYDPILSIKQRMKKFPGISWGDKTLEIWKGHQEMGSRLHYVTSDNTKDWEDQIDYLCQWLVEGLQKKEIRKLARELDCDDSQLGSIKLLEECLRQTETPEGTVDQIIDPLKELWKLRSKYSDHRGKDVKDDLYQDLREHFRDLVSECDKSMELLADLIQQGVFNDESF